MELIDVLQEHATKGKSFFNELAVDEVRELPFSEDIPSIRGQYWEKLIHTFSNYQKYLLESGLKNEFPFSFYKSKKICCEFAQKIPDYEKDKRKKFIVDWLRVCYRFTTEPEIRFFFNETRMNPENEIRKVIFEKPSNSNNLKLEFREEKWWLPYIEQLLDWFLKRYDLTTASRLIGNVAWRKNNEKTEKTAKKTIRRIPWLIIFASIITFFLFYALNFDLSDLLLWQKRGLHFNFNFLAIAEIIPLLVVLVFSLFFVLDPISLKNRSLYFKLLVPRLLGGILIGYLPVLFSNDLWLFVQKVDAFEGFFIVCMSAGFCLYYLVTEVRNVVYDGRIAFLRGIRVWLIGLLESLFLGILIQDLLARAFVKTFANGHPYTIPHVTGFLGGEIYPKVLLIYFPLALFIGIFVQIIWEEKPITQPL